MALLDFEGWDRETNLTLSNWAVINGGNAVSADGLGPFSYGRYFNNPNFWGRNLPNTQTIWIQSHFQQFGAALTGQLIWLLRDAGTVQIAVNFNNQHKCEILRGFTVVATSTNAVVALNAWYFVQIRVYFHNSAGTVDVYVNGTLVLSFTGDTTNTANAYCNSWDVASNNSATRIDNLLVYDETGAAPNAKTPETRVFADVATANGFVNAYTPSAGSNYQNIDEQPNDGDTTYNSAAAAGTDDLYTFPAATVPGGAVVYAVAAEIDARKDDAGTNDMAALIRSGGTTYQGASTFTLTTTYQRFRQMWTTDPNTGAAWTVANANAAEIGQRRTA